MKLKLLERGFDDRLDMEGIREVLILANERLGGCPFRCVGCGVHEEAEIVTPSKHSKIIKKQIANLSKKLNLHSKVYSKSGYHISVYNYGNITNHRELSEKNFNLLLKEINKLEPLPRHVSINSRGVFVSENLLQKIKNKKLDYEIRFIIGIESLTPYGGKIYGKPGIAKELRKMFSIINDFNKREGSSMGIDAGFVFLPEYYTKDRKNNKKILEGFLGDIREFISLYCGKKTPIKINLHPYYQVPNLSHKSAADKIHILIKAVKELQKDIGNINKKLPHKLHTSIFIGVNDTGYETPPWEEALSKWGNKIDQINKGKF